MTNVNGHATDAWIASIPDDNYALCPCGCGKKWKFAVKDGIEEHEKRFIEQFNCRKSKENEV